MNKATITATLVAIALIPVQCSSFSQFQSNAKAGIASNILS
jgi:hypothetical protein